jgi:hypothetical protein
MLTRQNQIFDQLNTQNTMFQEVSRRVDRLETARPNGQQSAENHAARAMNGPGTQGVAVENPVSMYLHDSTENGN